MLPLSSLELLRRQAGKTQSQVAAEIGCDRASISLWERGRRAPQQELLARYARALGIAEDQVRRLWARSRAAADFEHPGAMDEPRGCGPLPWTMHGRVVPADQVKPGDWVWACDIEGWRQALRVWRRSRVVGTRVGIEIQAADGRRVTFRFGAQDLVSVGELIHVAANR